MKKVYLIGAGCGRPDLITLRGLNILREADVVIYDYLVDKALLAETGQGAELICCDRLDKRRHSDGFIAHQEKITDLLIKKARQGKKVIRLKNGDVSIFSRYSQEAEALAKAGIKFEVVPGVTAASAASAFTGVPLTDRRFSSGAIFITGHQAQEKPEDSIRWKEIASSGLTIVLYMAVETIAKITDNLIKAGKPRNTPVVGVSNAGGVNQKTIRGNLGNIAELAKNEGLKAPAIFIIGEVALLERKFNPLNRNRRILFTGLSQERFFDEAAYFHLPLIKIRPLKDYREFDRHLKNIGNFDWLIFASRYAVEYFFQRFSKIGFDVRRLSDIKIAAIGKSTADKLADFGIFADLVPEDESSKGLLREFGKVNIRNKRIFMPRSDISDKGLEAGFKKLGAEVTAGFAYSNVMPDDLPDLDLKSFDEIMFTSPSGVRNFMKRYKRIPENVKARCIGEVTRDAFKKITYK